MLKKLRESLFKAGFFVIYFLTPRTDRHAIVLILVLILLTLLAIWGLGEIL